MPSRTVVIDTSTFSTPDEFFSSLQSYVSSKYYSDNTTFATGMPGPVSVAGDLRYFYGSCNQAGFLYGTCQTVNGLIVHKIAHKGPLYWTFCALVALRSGSEAGCDVTKASIDNTIAQEQFAELGPVIAQHVAAFVQFYAPALNLKFDGSGTGTVTSSPGTGIDDCTADCSALFVNDGNPITLTASPGSSFMGWGGDCSPAGMSTTAQVTLTADMNCSATFGPKVAVRLNPFGNQNGTVPYNVQVVDSTLTVTPAPQNITVTLLREVFSECSGLLFSSNRRVAVPQGQSSAAFNFDAGHDPNCNTLPITTVYTVTSAVLAPSTVLNLSIVPPQQLQLFSKH